MKNERNTQYNFLVVMGTFRTGSTFLAKALSTHPTMSVASDPYFMFFKSFRNEVFLREGVQNFDLDCPVSDNFWSPYFKVNKKIRDYSLNIPIQKLDLGKILTGIGRLAERDSPRIVPLLKSVKAENYSDLFIKLITIVNVAYGSETDKYTGFKCTFAEQFLKVLINTYPEIKCIYLLRDPRAIAASQKVYFERYKHLGRGRYPVYYVVLHWRKSIAYLIDNIHRKNNVFWIKYEDIVQKPVEMFKRISSFLSIEYNEGMVDADRYKDDSGGKWTQNSAFGTSSTINVNSIDKWKNILTGEEIQFIEDLCWPEMEALGYQRIMKDQILNTCMAPIKEDIDKIDPWILDYLSDVTLNEEKAEKELLRRYLIEKETESKYLTSVIVERLFIAKNYLNKIRKMI